MREFLLNSEEILDKEALAFLKEKGGEYGLFPCSWAYYNSRVKLVCFTDGVRPLTEMLPELSLDAVCDVGKGILRRLKALESVPEISLENVIWDQESIYLDERMRVCLICLPARLPQDSLQSQIYVKRVYALLQEIISRKEGGDIVCRQIAHQQESDCENWDTLETALSRRVPEEDEYLLLKSINTPDVLTFRVPHEAFRIGTDPAEVDGLIQGVEKVSPVHAEIGWNEISFYIRDLGSENGTFVNNQQIQPGIDVPIGEGTVLRFADCTFNVE